MLAPAAIAHSEDPPVAAPPGVVGSTLQPGTAIGDFVFQIDAAALRPAGDGKTVLRVLVHMPMRAILNQTRAERADLRLRLRVYPADAAFAALGRRNRRATLASEDSARTESARADIAAEAALADFDEVPHIAEAESPGRIEGRIDELLETDYRLFDLSVEVPAGDFVCEVRAENLSRRKQGLLDRVRKRPMASVARQLVRVPDLGVVPALADPTFHIGPKRSGYATRLYGLLADSLHLRATLFGEGDFAVRLTCSDRSGEVHWRDSTQVSVHGHRDLEWGTSVNTFPAGQYVLQWDVNGADGATRASRSFDVAWMLATWTRPRRDLDAEAELMLQDNELEIYRALPIGERERFLERYWTAHDPTPDTAINEVLEEFRRRVAYADLNFSETRRGALTDRGRVYVHFGRPEEVQAEAVPGHLAGRGAEEALEKVDDVYTASEHRVEDPDRLGSTRGTSAWDRSLRTQERSRVIGPANEVVSYELWLYAGGGEPLMPSDKGITIDAGLRVLFVDTVGHGRFRLRKSSARLDLRGITTNF